MQSQHVETFSFADMLVVMASIRRQSRQRLDELIADQIDMLAATARRHDCRTPHELRAALLFEADSRLEPSTN